jgi:hypothetical protein
VSDVAEYAKKLEILRKPLLLGICINDLRIMVGCFKAVAYLMKTDDEPYLDVDALDLQGKLENVYLGLLRESKVVI